MSQIYLLLGCGIAIAYFVFIARFVFRADKAFDDLAQFEHHYLPEQWEEDGEPRGKYLGKTSSPSKNWLKIFLLSQSRILALVWVFVTPKWAKDYPEAQKHLKALRQNVLWWNLGVLIPFLIFVLISLSVRLPQHP